MLKWIQRRAKPRRDGSLAVRTTVWIEADVYNRFVTTVTEGRKRSFVITEVLRKLLDERGWLDEIIDDQAPQSTPPEIGKTPKRPSQRRKTTRKKTATRSSSGRRPRQNSTAPESPPSSAPPPRKGESAPPPSASLSKNEDAPQSPPSTRPEKTTTQPPPPHSVRNGRTRLKGRR